MDYTDFTGLFGTRLRIDNPDNDGDVRIEISESDALAEIYIARDGLGDLIDCLIQVRDMPNGDTVRFTR